MIFAEGHLGATAAGTDFLCLDEIGERMLNIIKTTHGWAIVAQDFLILSLHGSYEEALVRRRQLLA